MNNDKQWKRTSNSSNNFDLALADPAAIDSAEISQLLDRIQQEKHRGLSLSARADSEFRRWLNNPDTPLKSDAYVLLSNWFCTQSGDRRSMVASRCEDLWDALFPCRPVKRLSSPEPGRNHMMMPEEFEGFWKQVRKAQGELSVPENTPRVSSPNAVPQTGSDTQPARALTIPEAKAALALTFGVAPENIEITIRG